MMNIAFTYQTCSKYLTYKETTTSPRLTYSQIIKFVTSILKTVSFINIHSILKHLNTDNMSCVSYVSCSIFFFFNAVT